MHVNATAMEQWWQMTPQAQPALRHAALPVAPHCIIQLREGEQIGDLTYSIDANHRALIDFKLAYPFWGHGYATEALRLALRELFTTTGVRAVLIEPAQDNPAAMKVLQRCGFHPVPTENHPNRWECTRADFAVLDVTQTVA
jgi:RimJ/RimL family protein N-acetyltransferase